MDQHAHHDGLNNEFINNAAAYTCKALMLLDQEIRESSLRTLSPEILRDLFQSAHEHDHPEICRVIAGIFMERGIGL